MNKTLRKKAIASFFINDSSNWVKEELGCPPYSAEDINWLLHGELTLKDKSLLRSTQRTLDLMVKDGTLSEESHTPSGPVYHLAES